MNYKEGRLNHMYMQMIWVKSKSLFHPKTCKKK